MLPKCRFTRYIQGSFTCRKATTWDRRLYSPSEGRRAEDFFRPNNPTVSTGFEPANLGTKGQHATSRSPKPYFVHSPCQGSGPTLWQGKWKVAFHYLGRFDRLYLYFHITYTNRLKEVSDITMHIETILLQSTMSTENKLRIVIPRGLYYRISFLSQLQYWIIF
jgi:hypothetical protein